ncbi:T9SS type A sorting domain-containing protein [Longitalea luteola]|uniref:T9SS type A sorting domain-containing protein n=1 Tax=Longitalea luteola TaxID=2812563 RepID=UPI001A960886|nr:T9SS type A sorting domain-containing protein [Longitalea luteola]
MKRTISFALAFLILQIKGIAQVSFTPGNIVVYRVGTGPATLGNASAAVFLDEYTTAGTLVQSIAMPVTTSGSNKALTATGRGDTEGILTLSADGQYLVFTGYNAPVGTGGIGGTSSTSRPRTIGLVKYDGTINTSTALTDLSSANAVRCAVSTNGTDLWAVGAGSFGTTGGVRYATVGASTSTQITDPTESTGFLRCLAIIGGQLYVSGNSNTPRIGTVGTGLPKTADQTITNLPDFPDTIMPGQFALLDMNAGVPGPDVLYYTNDNTGIEKYSLVSGSWVLNGNVGASVDDYRAFTAILSGNTVTLYATRRGANNTTIKGGQLVRLTDASGYNGVFSATPVALANAITNQTAFRGVAPAPVLNVLPVKLLGFTAGKVNNDVRLNWSATEAVRFSHFEVERSMDGMTFSAIGKVEWQLSAIGNATFNFTDPGILQAAPNNMLYYRLRMVDADGKVDYSKIVRVATDHNPLSLINVYPTPFVNEIFVKTAMITTGKVDLSLADLSGRVLTSKNTFVPSGENVISVPLPAELPKGIYLLRVRINDQVTTVKLFK